MINVIVGRPLLKTGRFYSRKRPNVTNAYKCQQDPTILTCHMELVTEQFHLGENNSICFSCRPKLHPRSGKATSLSDASIDSGVALWLLNILHTPRTRFKVPRCYQHHLNPTNHFAASHVWSQPGSRLPWKSRLRLKFHHYVTMRYAFFVHGQLVSFNCWEADFFGGCGKTDLATWAKGSSTGRECRDRQGKLDVTPRCISWIL